MRVAVTGAAGFVGRHVCRALLAAGMEVRALVRGGRDRIVPGTQLAPILGLEDEPGLVRALDGVDAVVHLAARVHVMRETDTDPLARFRAVNVEGTRQLLGAMDRCGIRRLLLASSAKAVAEQSLVPWTEQAEPAPSDPYGISKREAEELVFEWARGAGAEAWALRLPLIYGPGVGANFLRLLRAVDRGFPIPVPLIDNRRSLLYVGNLTHVITSLLQTSNARAAGLLNVADRRAVSTLELTRAVARALGRRPRVVPLPLALLRAAGSLGDLLAPIRATPLSMATVRRLTGSLELDTGELEATLGHRLPMDLDEGLATTVDWLRTGRGA